MTWLSRESRWSESSFSNYMFVKNQMGDEAVIFLPTYAIHDR